MPSQRADSKALDDAALGDMPSPNHTCRYLSKALDYRHLTSGVEGTEWVIRIRRLCIGWYLMASATLTPAATRTRAAVDQLCGVLLRLDPMLAERWLPLFGPTRRSNSCCWI